MMKNTIQFVNLLLIIIILLKGNFMPSFVVLRKVRLEKIQRDLLREGRSS